MAILTTSTAWLLTTTLNSPLVYASGQQGTIALQLRPGFNSGDSTWYQIFMYWTGVGNDRTEFLRYSDNNVYIGAAALTNTRVTFADTGLFTSGQWSHWALSWTIGGTQFAYRNGIQQGSGACTNAVTQHDHFGIGVNNGGAAPSASGYQDFALWNVALSPAEIYALAHGARPNQIRPRQLLSGFPMDGYQGNEMSPGASGALIADRSIYNLNQSTSSTGISFIPGPPWISAAPILPALPDPKSVMPPQFMVPPPPFILMPQIVM